jgi:hypothetical protein
VYSSFDVSINDFQPISKHIYNTGLLRDIKIEVKHAPKEVEFAQRDTTEINVLLFHN